MAVEALVRAVLDIEPFDEVEHAHQVDAADWLSRTDDVYRRAAPATPPKHLVAYFLVRDPSSGSVLLVDHRKAGMWLPTGGHVEPDENPLDAVRREAAEELGIVAQFAEPAATFITVTETVGAAATRHVDVSLWYLLNGDESEPLYFDSGEFTAARWWTPAEISGLPRGTVEPHLHRFLAKMTGSALGGAAAGR